MKRQQMRRMKPVPVDCNFCKTDTHPWYRDVGVLQKFISDRGKVLAHTRTGVCSKHQRRIATEIKRARHIALLSFVQR